MRAADAQDDEFKRPCRRDAYFGQHATLRARVRRIVFIVTLHKESLVHGGASQCTALEERKQKTRDYHIEFRSSERVVWFEDGPLYGDIDRLFDHHHQSTNIDKDPIRIAADSARPIDPYPAAGQRPDRIDAQRIENPLDGIVDSNRHILHPGQGQVGRRLVDAKSEICLRILAGDVSAGRNVARDRSDPQGINYA